MSNFSDSSSPFTANEESMQTALESGLSALRQKNYQAAIAQLETITQTTSHVPTLLRAQMGLVKAYSAAGNPDRAIVLCQSLQNHVNPQVNAWAKQTLAELERRSAGATGSEPTGFTPLVASSPAAPAPDGTGFVPLSAAPETVRERVASKPSQNSPKPAQNRPPGYDRILQEPEETEILPLDARDADVQWQTVTSKSELVSPQSVPPSRFTRTTAPAVKLDSKKLDSKKPDSVKPDAVKLPSSVTWRQAGRAQKWTSLSQAKPFLVWALQPLTVLLLWWMICLLIGVAQDLLNWLIFCFSWLPFLPSRLINVDATWAVALTLAVLFVASPWLLQWLLQWLYQLKPLSLSELERHSPEAVRLLKRVKPVPRLGVLPVTAPLAFSYGWLPRLAGVVVSQGLLQQLSDDEIATIYAAELGHIQSWNAGILSGLVLVAQLPYRLYWSIATWGNRQTDRVLQSVAVFVSAIGYGVYWCCRLAGLWLSQLRLYHSDQTATNLTGNPNGLSRALLKIALGTAAEIQRQSYTDPLLESFDLLLPVGHRTALTPGSFYAHTPTPTLFVWDRLHRFRRWFACTTGHPLLGDRLYKLSIYAQRWRLESELNWGQEHSSSQNPRSKTQTPSLKRFFLQISPLLGILLGVAIGLALWLLGWITSEARSYSFDWIWYERQAFAKGCALLGFGIGLLIQINPAFRDTPRSNRQTEADLAALLSNPTAMPIDSTPVRLQGKLLGRSRFHNRFYQDLLLHTSVGLLRLHYTSKGGFLGDLFSQSQRPTDLMKPDETVSVTGWLRRGAVASVDVETIQTRRGIVRSGRPIWLTVVAILSALWGVYTIFKGR